ncbi:dihydroorotate dehydrogenase [Candidatus Aerophobetes bacterium]|uniref:Dihydroorotate dehydrogenase n=1 Tax=Aerophobetes bacterium TaxID=2030807 RepID=A0A2A4YFJ2_UNCAE|nr:MAG: dihydroorotate dehydrogenase [Candidatus Aerophobetes bacterium]
MLTNEKLPKWTKESTPIYDIKRSYTENLEQGPFFDSAIPKRDISEIEVLYDFLGVQVASPLGVPAGPLLGSKWTTLAGKLGFDIVTYKTIRSRKHNCHPLPNMLYVDVDHKKKIATLRDNLPEDIAHLGVTNSFGMPSMDKDYLMEDIKKAHEGLGKNQVLVVSFVGTPSEDTDFFTDFADAGLLAKEAGAKIVEANFSCPNVATKEGSIYKNEETVYALGKKLKDALGDTPLIIKVGVFDDIEHMRKVFIAAARAGIDAISGINTLSMKAITKEGKPALDEHRKTSGICGGPIREAGLNFVRCARKVIREEKLKLTLIGVGGITTKEHFDAYLEAGADFVQTATGMMWDPLLAMRHHNQKGKLV